MTEAAASATPLHPVGKYIVAEETTHEALTGSGIVLPNNTLDQPAFAKVLAVGDEGKCVAAGDVVVHKQDKVVTVYAEGKAHLLFTADAVMAKMRSGAK